LNVMASCAGRLTLSRFSGTHSLWCSPPQASMVCQPQ
jgi:hypothetical protein